MQHSNLLLAATAIAAAFVLGAATATPPHVRSIDAAHSTMTVYVYKEGIFAFAADNHEVSAPIASGSLDDESKAIDVTIDATKMHVLDPTMAPAKRAEVQANMLGPEVLDVAMYPKIEFKSTAVKSGSAGDLTVTGDLTLHGQTHSIAVQVTSVDASHFRGSADVRQSEFGITPIRIAGGTVRVKDDVKVDFDIVVAH